MTILIENIGKKAQEELGNYISISYSDKLRIPTDVKNPTNTANKTFMDVKSSPSVRTIEFSNSFIKSLYKLPDKLISLIPMAQFFLLILSKGKESSLPPNYHFHSIPAEIKDHYVVHIGGDYAIRFRIETNRVILKDFLSHSERGYQESRMDVSKIDFSKVEGITDARTIHGNPEHLIEQVNKGFILAINDADYKSLMKAFFEYHFDNQ